MNIVSDYIRTLLKRKKIGLMTHAVIGFPTLKETEVVVRNMVNSGVDIIELQFPFSDPLADGPTIVRANSIALAQGIHTDTCFDFLSKLTREISIPIFIMGYYQTVFHIGVDQFCKRAKQAGASGLIIPDIPPDEEEYEHFMLACQKNELAHISVLSPAVTPERLHIHEQLQNGFVYVTTRNGITGSQETLDASLSDFLRTVRKYIHIPIAVGFGISKPDHIQALVGHADIAVIGSALIEQIEKHGIQSVNGFITDLMQNTSHSKGDI
jgi:tryptophan synthase alpha chain